MSWTATAWAERQVTGHPSRKAILLVLANYADKEGFCWPSQETLAAGAELSVDTIQRQTKKLQSMDLIRVERLPKKRGQWQGFCYYLNLSKETKPHRTARPQNEVRSTQIASVPENGNPGTGDTGVDLRPGHAAQMRPDQAASIVSTEPQALRHKPSIEPSIEPALESSATPKPKNTFNSGVERLRAFQGKQEATEVVQNRIARRLGSNGWLILGEMNGAQLEKLTALERRGQLDDATLDGAAAQARLNEGKHCGGVSKV